MVGDAAEGVFDRQLVEHIGIVVVEPFLGLGVVRMFRVCSRVKRLVKAGDAAAVLGRRVALAGDVAGVGEFGVAGADVGDREPMFPAIAEVIFMDEPRLLLRDNISEFRLSLVQACVVKFKSYIRVLPAPNHELMQV